MTEEEVQRTLFEQRRKTMIKFITEMKYENDPHFIFIAQHKCDDTTISEMRGCTAFVLACASSISRAVLGLNDIKHEDN